MATKKKVASKKKYGVKITDEAYSKKEMENIHNLVDTVLKSSPKGKDNTMGMVIVSHMNEKGEFPSLGGRRNMSEATVMSLVLRILGMTPMDGAILLAQINAEMQKAERMSKLISKKKKK